MQVHDTALVLVVGPDRDTETECDRWRGRGAVVMHAHDAGGCLRVATSVGPDLIVLDRRTPRRLVRLLRAHPVSAGARISWLQAAEPTVEPRAA
ncbi:MAG: hypothetical protein JO057_25680 [Chloroflexi bacterium]|nr:hypothetical protein [Chloroflexota bacterium]